MLVFIVCREGGGIRMNGFELSMRMRLKKLV